MLFREPRYNPDTAQRTKHRIEEKNVAVGDVRRELQRRHVRVCHRIGITGPL